MQDEALLYDVKGLGVALPDFIHHETDSMFAGCFQLPDGISGCLV
jgi:hypothetical protein